MIDVGKMYLKDMSAVIRMKGLFHSQNTHSKEVLILGVAPINYYFINFCNNK